MILKLQMYDRTITIEESRDDLTTHEMLELFKCMLLASEYHPDSIKQTIIEFADEYKDE